MSVSQKKSSIPEIPYSQFSDKVHNLGESERIPLNGSIELTHRCNVSCVHCLTSCDWHKEKELETAEVFRIIDDLANEGCQWLLLTGGEPLLREDFLDVYTYIKKKGIFVTLFTNGTLITKEIADHFAKWRPFSIEITLHAVTKNAFESVTRTPGSFEKCMQGINLLLERKVPLELKTMVMTLNKHELGLVSKLAKGLGLNYRFSSAIEPKQDRSKEPLQYRLKPQEVIGLDKHFQKRRSQYEKRCKNLTARDKSELYACTGGFFSFHINPYGRLTLCEMLQQPSYDLKRASFASNWQTLYEELKMRKASKNFKCLGCQAFEVCEACPALFLRENGNEEEVSEYYCEIAQERVKAFKRGGGI